MNQSGVNYFSTIDHFVTTQRVYDAISDAGVIHSGENPSNHSAIYAKLEVGQLDLSMENHPSPVRVQWGQATSDAQEKYKSCLSEELNNIILLGCVNYHDVHCNEHNAALEDYTMDVMRKQLKNGPCP